jgi:hypothetical protein
MPRPWCVIVVLATLASFGCKSKGELVAKTYTLEVPGEKPVAVEISIPSTWTEEVDTDGPEFKIPGLSGGMVSITAIGLSGDTAETLKKAIALQYGEADEAKDAQRTDLPGGRVWMIRKERSFQHARVFVPVPGGVAMGVALVEDAQLPEIKKAFETLKLASSAR